MISDNPAGIPAPLREIGRYQVFRELGRGAMGRVHLARQVDLERDVALKELTGLHADSPESIARFLREARLGGSLNHPNVVTVHEYFEVDTTPYIAMEYVPRGPLRPYVGRLDLSSFAGVMEGVLAGLAHAQTRGIVHRDLKPENIMVTSEGRVKIADFGIAKATQTVAGTGMFATATGALVGTPRYMAPEQILGEEVGIWTDMYALGVMAYEHAVGRPPFEDKAPTALLMRHVRDPIQSPCDLNPSIDTELSQWVDRLLVKDRVQRISDPLEAWDQLEEIVLRLLGPRWRRDARLPDKPSALDPPRPLTPAPFGPPRLTTTSQTAASPNGPSIDTHAATGKDLPTTRVATPLMPSPEPTRKSVRPDRAASPHPVDSRDDARRQAATRRNWRRPALVIAGLAAVICAAVIGFASGHGNRDANAGHASTRTVTAGHVGLDVPASWTQPTNPPTLPGMTFGQPLVRTATPQKVLIAGQLSGATGRLLLPSGFVSRQSPTPKPDDPVQLGTVSAYRYKDLTVPGLQQRVTLFVAPTSFGVIGIACVYPPGSTASFVASCERAASTLRISGGRSLPLGPNAAYGRALSASVGNVSRAASLAQGLRSAPTATAQAKLLSRLSALEAQAMRELAGATPGPDAAGLNARLISELRAASDDYAAMSRAAAQFSERRYDPARRRAQAALAQSRTTISDLRAIGYGSPAEGF